MRFDKSALDASHECHNVLRPAQRVNAFVSALPEASSEHTFEQMRHLPLADRSGTIVVRQIALSEGNDQHAFLQLQKLAAPLLLVGSSPSRSFLTRVKLLRCP